MSGFSEKWTLIDEMKESLQELTIARKILLILITIFIAISVKVMLKLNVFTLLISTGILLILLTIFFVLDNSRTRKAKYLVNTFMGINLILLGFVHNFKGTYEMIKLLINFSIPTVFLGTSVIFFIYTPNRNLKRCTKLITATCIGLQDSRGQITNLISKEGPIIENVRRPIWKFTYEGKQYTVCEEIYYTKRVNIVGDKKKLLINIKNPEEFTYLTKKIRKKNLVLGIITLFFAIFCTTICYKLKIL